MVLYVERELISRTNLKFLRVYYLLLRKGVIFLEKFLLKVETKKV